MADKEVRVNHDYLGVNRPFNIPPATQTGEPVTYEQWKAALDGFAWKDNARVATQSNINIASPGATIDGITLVVGDRVLVKAQSATSQNGIYIWNGAAVSMSRSDDASTADELESAVIPVDEGTDAGAAYRQTAVNFILDTNPVTFVLAFSVTPPASTTQAGAIEIATQGEVDTGTDTLRAVTPATLKDSSHIVKRNNIDFGDGSATQFDLTHNRNSKDVQVQIRKNSNDALIECYVMALDVNTIRVIATPAPAINELRAVIKL